MSLSQLANYFLGRLKVTLPLHSLVDKQHQEMSLVHAECVVYNRWNVKNQGLRVYG